MKLRDKAKWRVLLLVGAVLNVCSMEVASQTVLPNLSDSWVRVESEKKDFSVMLPADFFVRVLTYDNGKRTFVKKDLNGFQNAVRISVAITSGLDPQEAKNRVSEEGSVESSADFEMPGGVKGRFFANLSNGYHAVILLAHENSLFRAELWAASKDQSEVGRFIRSLTAMGKSLFTAKSEADDSSAKIISWNELVPSAQVEEAFKRKSPPFRGKVAFFALAEKKDCEIDLSVRPALAVSLINPTGNYVPGIPPKPDLFSRNVSNGGGPIYMRFLLRSNGQVGDIDIYSDVDRRVLEAYAESAKTLKFVPASKDGINVDACHTDVFTFTKR